MHLSRQLALACACAALSLGIAVAAPVAMVTDMHGASAMTQKDKAKLTLMAYIEPGTEIQVEPGAKLTLTYFARAQEQTFSGPAKIRVQADKVEVLQGASGSSRKLDPDNVSAAKQFEPAARDRMTAGAFVMRSASPRLALVGPVETRLSMAVPEFSWSASKDVSEFKLTLMDGQGKVLREASVSGDSWKPAEALQYGRDYQWKVETAGGSAQSESAQAGFSLIGEASAKRLAKHRPGKDASFSERLLFAAQLDNAGLKYEAMQQWRLLAAERPEDAVLQKLAR